MNTIKKTQSVSTVSALQTSIATRFERLQGLLAGAMLPLLMATSALAPAAARAQQESAWQGWDGGKWDSASLEWKGWDSAGWDSAGWDSAGWDSAALDWAGAEWAGSDWASAERATELGFDTQDIGGIRRAVGKLDRVPFNIASGDETELQLQCLRVASAARLPYVKKVTVNGRVFRGTNRGGIFTLAQACLVVVSQAR